MEEIIGHEKVLEFFTKVMANNQLSHAYCFVGQNGVGKKRVAEWLAAKILGVTEEKLKATPDYILVERLFDEKEGKTKKDIIVEQIRDLRGILARSAFLGGNKVALIDQAELLNKEGANAFLKNLEEPTAKTTIFLLTDNEKELPETIRSRCQIIYFYPVPREKILAALLKKGVEKTRAEELSRLSRGLPGLALNWLNQPEEWEVYQKETNRFLSLLGKSFYLKLQAVEDLFGDKTDHVATREKLQIILSNWQLLVRDIFLKDNGLEIYSLQKVVEKKINSQELLEIEEKIFLARDWLEKNIHPRLLVEQILLELP